jgi:hypothetical protein
LYKPFTKIAGSLEAGEELLCSEKIEEDDYEQGLKDPLALSLSCVFSSHFVTYLATYSSWLVVLYAVRVLPGYGVK